MRVWPKKSFFFFTWIKKLGRFEKYIPLSLSNRCFVTEVYIPQSPRFFPQVKKNYKLEMSLGLQKILLYLKNILPRQNTSLTDFLSSTPDL